MEREEITALIETRENTRPNTPHTRSHEIDVILRGATSGVMTIEYVPEGRVLTGEWALELAVGGYFTDEEANLEELVSDLYYAIVDLLYPRSSYVSDPWDVVPLVVSVEAENGDGTYSLYSSVGSYG